MSWDIRIREAAYTTPSGERLLFLYEDLSTSVEKLDTAHNFPSVEGTYVQQHGRSGRRFPMSIILSGEDCDIDANNFEQGLFERGVGVLEHPMHGQFNVVPFGKIERTDALKTAANQVIITVEFWETTGAVYPSSGKGPADSVDSSKDEYNDKAAAESAEVFDFDGVFEVTTFIDTIKNGITAIKNGMRAVNEAVAAVEDAVNFVYDSINEAINLLVATPLALANQIQVLSQLPSRSTALVEDRLAAYRTLADSIFGKDPETPAFTSVPDNNFFVDDMFAQNMVVGMALSTVNTTYDSQSQAIAAADALAAVMADLIVWRDGNFASLGRIDTGDSYQALLQLFSVTLGALIELALQLPLERTITLQRPRSIVEMCAEFYGEVDARLDQFITQNNLTGDEIFEVPTGRRVTYYV